MDLGDVVHKARKHHKEKQTITVDDVAGGTTGTGVPEAHKASDASSLTSRPADNTDLPSPPTSPLYQTSTRNSSRSAHQRPKHRSQASFDWFADRPGDSVGQREGGGASGGPNGAWDRGESKAYNFVGMSSSKSRAPYFDSPLVQSEDEGEEEEEGTKPDKAKDEDEDGSKGNVLRGAFTTEDKMRGAKNMDEEKRGRGASSRSGSSGPAEKSKKKKGSTTDDEGVAKGKDKGKNVRMAGDEDDAEWVDENRDGFVEGSSTKREPGEKRGSGGARKQSLWGGAAGFLSGGKGADQSGTSTPDAGSDRESTAPEKEKKTRPPNAQRRGSAWGVVRQKLGAKEKPKKKKAGESLTGHELVAELTTGVLPMVLVKMSLMDRDERGDHRIPILMNYLKLRITDSLYPFHDKHAVFRIELEYGDSAVKWVIYRELKDFVNLHAHYRVANLRQGIDKFPTFPKTSLPYLNWLKSEKGTVKKADFAKAQREALEDYLLKLIRATMFGAGANRLCKFLEISAMSLSLATRGGMQGKQGYLSILSSGASRRRKQGFHPLDWKNRHEPKWFIVRDSYVVAVDDPSSTEIYDVIMVDSTFEIERPKRIFRQGFNTITGNHNDSSSDLEADQDDLVASEKRPIGRHGAGDPDDPSTTNDDPNRLKDSSQHTFYLRSSERKLRLVAKTERQQDQFIASIEKMVAKTIWGGKNRFDSFAPIRLNASAQWLIDGRDYFWSLSRAILLAKHKIYIHDWWLSPELYLRRPAATNEKWRLDRLLQRKAEEGVQIFVIVYKEVSNDFTPVESNYTKTRLRALHPNVHIQRSPSHTSTGTLLWSHHEKMCVIDETIGFMGGLDLCFGRWDTPGHVLIDDGPNVVCDPEAKNSADQHTRENSQIWPGKDYNNSRVLDFHTLTKPDEDMYDRGKVPRQPWHDIGLQIIGQPARDLCRHFIQRWNYLLRTKNHTVKMPFLLPAPDFTPRELQEQRITGTCEVQICRSVGPWSMGISHVEHSIQNAYCKAIQLSDHFVYIENQFFITSTEMEGTMIENKIGDALVSRILAAHSEGTPWRAIIIIPLVPGYPFPINAPEASSVRLIMACQFASISRGPGSIFARLRREGIDPDEYISFFGLRGWGKLGSGALTTEAVYIHAKAMVVDDRIALIGSANINERSQRGDRDSELCCIIRDTDMIDSTMGGKPYQVGRFAHTMRVRLMREHLGIDVDELEAEEQDAAAAKAKETEQKKKNGEEVPEDKPPKMAEQEEAWDPDHEQEIGDQGGPKIGRTFHWAGSLAGAVGENVANVAGGAKEAVGVGLEKTIGHMGVNLNAISDRMHGATQKESEAEADETHADMIVSGEMEGKGFASSVVPTLEEKVMAEGRPHKQSRQDEGHKPDKMTMNQKEMKRGVSINPPGQDDSPMMDASASKTNGDSAATNGDASTKEGDKASETQETEPAIKDPPRSVDLETVTMSNPDIDDTRKLEVELEDGKDLIRPLAPITEGSRDDVPRRIKDQAPPPDIAAEPPLNGQASNDRLSPDDKRTTQDGSNVTTNGRSRSPSSAGGPQRANSVNNRNKGNENAVNRNQITNSLRRNLKERGNVYTIPVPAPIVDPHGFADPLVDSFYKDVWMAAAVRNTQAYRKVFRCVPDDLVQTWKQYREFQTWAERHNKAPKDVVPPGDDPPFSDPAHHQGTHGAGGGGSGGGAMGQGTEEPPKGETMHRVNSRANRQRATSSVGSSGLGGGMGSGGGDGSARQGRDRSGTLAGEGHDHDEGFPEKEREQMEECLEEVLGHLVIFPTRFLEAEDAGGNFLFAKDRLPPLSIYD